MTRLSLLLSMAPPWVVWGRAHSEPGQRRGRHADWPVRMTWVRNGPTERDRRTGICIRFGSTAFYVSLVAR